MQQQWYSPDGRWQWDGASWRPVPPAGGPPGMFWFLNSPEWAGPFFLTGLILLVPIVGQIVLYGWYLAARDNLSRGWRVVPKAGFEYLERGVRPWAAFIVYFLYVLPVYILLVAGLIAAIVAQSGLVIAVLVVALVLFWLASSVTFGFLSGAIYDVADAQGIGAAIDPRRIWAAATATPRASWRIYGTFVLGTLLLFAVGLPIAFVIPFGGLLLNFAVPAIYLMAAPAQAEFNRP